MLRTLSMLKGGMNRIMTLLFLCLVLLIVLMEYVQCPLAHRTVITGTVLTYLGDIEKSLCLKKLTPVNVIPSGRVNCPENGIVTVIQGGRLGNQMYEYAAVWAVARKTGLQPYVPQCIRHELDQYFEDLSVPSLSNVSNCRVNWDNKVLGLELWRHKNQSILLRMYVQLPEIVLTWPEDIRLEFRFKRRFVEASRKTLKSVGQDKNGSAPIYIGVHVRRTDYIQYLKGKGETHLAGAKYFISAMDYFRNKFSSNLVFVVLSDDPEWCRRNLVGQRKDVFVVSHGGIYNPGEDLALMAACNHSIIDYGTYGVWGAILANGETIVFNMPNRGTVDVAKVHPKWRVWSSNFTAPSLEKP